MVDRFQQAPSQLELTLQQLIESPLRDRDELGGIPQKGIYVFYEGEDPLYVGRSDRLKNRIQVHGRHSSTHNSAAFAFNLAKEQTHNLGLNVDNVQRQVLERDPSFQRLFKEAKERIVGMRVRVVPVEDPILQTLFEVYAAVRLGTLKYNDFDTH